MDIEGFIAASNRANQFSESGEGNCSRTWHVGFFFDGIHRNVELDLIDHRISNISRLFRAFPDESYDNNSNAHSKFYISGLGTPFRENLTSKIHAIMDGAQNSIMGDLKEQPKEMAKNASIDILKGEGWWEVIKESGRKLINPAEWKSLSRDMVKNTAIKVLTEATSALRDHPIVADMMVTGVDTRISSTKITFEESFKEIHSNSPVPIKIVSVSIFGYDLGATLARKFIDLLLDNICQKSGEKYYYQNIPVEIVFTGFFDCARHTPASNTNGVDWFVSAAGGPVKAISALLGERSIDQESALRDAVKNALHLVAAHETRPWRRLYCLGSSNANHREELLPGCSEDIGGGLKADEQKPSAELCRVALHKMYRAATMAGVPYPDFQRLEKIDADIAAYFVMHDNVNNKSVATWAEMYQQAVPYNTVSVSAQNHHLDSYFEWLGQQYYQYRSECLKYEKENSRVLNSAGASAGLAGFTTQARKEVGSVQDELTVLRTHWGWLEDVHDAAIRMQNSMETNPHDKRLHIVPEVYGPALRRAKRFLEYAHAAYHGAPQPIPFDRAPPEMYAWFVHNIQSVDKGATISQDFLVIRSMEKPQS